MIGHFYFENGDGTRYEIVTNPDPHGGVLVIWPNNSTWRYHQGDRLKFLHGQYNEYTEKAIFDYLEALQ